MFFNNTVYEFTHKASVNVSLSQFAGSPVDSITNPTRWYLTVKIKIRTKALYQRLVAFTFQRLPVSDLLVRLPVFYFVCFVANFSHFYSLALPFIKFT